SARGLRLHRVDAAAHATGTVLLSRPVPHLDWLAVAMDNADQPAWNHRAVRSGVPVASPPAVGGTGDRLVPGLPRDDRHHHPAGTGLRAPQLLRQLRRAAGRGAMAGGRLAGCRAARRAPTSLAATPARAAGLPAAVVGRIDHGYRLRLGRPAAAGSRLGRARTRLAPRPVRTGSHLHHLLALRSSFAVYAAGLRTTGKSSELPRVLDPAAASVDLHELAYGPAAQAAVVGQHDRQAEGAKARRAGRKLAGRTGAVCQG